MALNNLSDFIGIMASGKFARKNQYEFRIYPPGGITYKGGGISELSLRCESVTLPGQTLASNVDELRLGPGRECVYNVTFAPLTAVFLSDNRLNEKTFFEDWQNLAFDRITHKLGYYDDYKADMTINQLNSKGETVYSAKLIDAWPKAIAQMDLAASDTELVRLSVELAYYRWEPMQLAAPL
tara:strand:+ start:762 stop:1307 length:546 start_codon:yes stop_codon:yes gene_type:complete